MTKQLISLLGAPTILFLTACQHQPAADGSAFPQEGALRAPQRFAETQAASGARHDATLTATHFSAGALNSLGQAKLDAMLADDDLVPLVVYINLPDGALTDSRHAAVTGYLHDAGLRDEQIQLQSGINPETFHLASLQSSILYQPGETGLTAADSQAPQGQTDTQSDLAPVAKGFGGSMMR